GSPSVSGPVRRRLVRSREVPALPVLGVENALAPVGLGSSARGRGGCDLSDPSRLIGVDVGGTFTDVVAIEQGGITTTKVPTNLVASEESVLEGAKQVEPARAGVFNLATTAGINALITRRLPKVAFLTTMGHRDILDRGRLRRPHQALQDPS